MLKTKAEIQAWLDKMGVKNYTINNDLTVDVDEDVDIRKKKLTEIPVQFGIVKGDFDCYGNQLTTLKGAPKECKFFECHYNNLTTLEGAPKECRFFDCSNNQLTSLEFAPEKCVFFNCSNNQLTSLEGSPKECKKFNCSNNQLTSLEGSPKECKEAFHCSYNKLTSLEFAPKFSDNMVFFKCDNNKLTSLKGGPEKCGIEYDCSYNELTTLEFAPRDFVMEFRCQHNKLASLDGIPSFGDIWSDFPAKVEKIYKNGGNNTSSTQDIDILQFLKSKKLKVWETHWEKTESILAGYVVDIKKPDMSAFDNPFFYWSVCDYDEESAKYYGINRKNPPIKALSDEDVEDMFSEDNDLDANEALIKAIEAYPKRYVGYNNTIVESLKPTRLSKFRS